MFEVAIAVVIIGIDEEGVETEVGRGCNGFVDGLDDISMAAPDGVFTWLGRAIFMIDAAEAQAQY